MKKIAILALSCATFFGAMAQVDVVKDAERQLKGSSPDHAKIRATIKPALSNTETSGKAQTWFIAGKNEFANYDKQYGARAIGQKFDGKDMGHSVIDGYNYFLKALPLDSVADAKGKIKTKYSNEIAKTISGHYNDFNQAALLLWEAQDYEGAYQAWDIYLTVPTMKAQLGKHTPTAPHDSINSEIMFNQGLAAWQADRLNDAVEALIKAKDHGYLKKNVFDYAISVAYQLGRNDTVCQLAAEALPLYGSEDPKYIGLVINGYIEKKDFSTAQNLLSKYIAADPNNAQLYDAQGILIESQKTAETPAAEAQELDNKALESYQKAVSVNPEFARGNYDLGRKLVEKAYSISEAAESKDQASYNKVKEEEIFPLFRQGAEYLEKAYKLDPENLRDALRYLRSIYYNLNDEVNLKRVEELQ